ncbi:hypothetical protein SAICODRAFT_30214 [Saitoella complicata NRRL Y-17804]|uniref:Protein byr4 n=1 Tax=Saitoella complicata (strain BCRC 22490 / CBS 7301 / JCM 7358 / NBRC 10748 / NRRL Y-17804) TaxID=698492 RepID=A0A0E9N8V0_SAICN|nr:uncharacterized protein SAICODRAFT_30214 [Saitoella complicata NRRL Y-17804]ODQ53121.1 hypothetical protein SAICODRAFT_30214 [Saitoella complicata NRRL Y-17804]GAO46244.1 hypothetical protein G7K_0479-t1 [Saitoella complicata NRRL Y-17804]
MAAHLRRGSTLAIESWDDDEDFTLDTQAPPTLPPAKMTSSPPAAPVVVLEADALDDFPDSDDGDFEEDFELPVTGINAAVVVEKARNVGISLPVNAPASAFTSGTITKLGSGNVKVPVLEYDDWEEEIDLSGLELSAFEPLELKPGLRSRQASVASTTSFGSPITEPAGPKSAAYQRLQSIRPRTIPTKAMQAEAEVEVEAEVEDMADEFDLPPDFDLMKAISTRQMPSSSTPKHPAPSDPDHEEREDWGEGSLGIRTARSNRSSMTSAAGFSPGLSTGNNTMSESDDEGVFGGLLLPHPGFDFRAALAKRQAQSKVEALGVKSPLLTPDVEEDDLESGLEITEDAFNPAKLEKKKITRRDGGAAKISLVKNVQMELRFTPSPAPGPSRIPKLKASTPDLRSAARGGWGMGTPLSTTRVPPPATRVSSSGGPLVPPPPKENQKPLTKKQSMLTLRQPTLTPRTSTPNLRASSSISSLRTVSASHASNPSRVPTVQVPQRSVSSRFTPARSMTPIVDTATDTPTQSRPPLFFAGGIVGGRSHHAALRHQHREPSYDRDRAPSALSMRSPNERQGAGSLRLAPPKRYGDGTELDRFDDLAVSPAVERKFMVSTVSSRGLEKKASVQQLRTKQSIPQLRTKKSGFLQKALPAVPPNAVAQRAPPPPAQSARVPSPAKISTLPFTPIQPRPSRPRAVGKLPNDKLPKLIQNLGATNTAKTINGMHYNPRTFKWEGNSDDTTLVGFSAKEKGASPRPALISNWMGGMGAAGVRQIVGGMVWDPKELRWVNNKNADGEDSEDEDPFEGIEDIKSEETAQEGWRGSVGRAGLGHSGDFFVGEEFDLGPNFIRFQKNEEKVWQDVVEGHIGEAWRERRDLWAVLETLLKIKSRRSDFH